MGLYLYQKQISRDLGQKIHRRFAKLGGVDLPLAAREAIRPADFAE